MTSWTWVGLEDQPADWADPDNWYNETDHKSDDGTPQDGDDIVIDVSAAVAVPLGSVSSLDFTGHSLVTGNYTVTGVEDRGDLVGGTMNIARGNSVSVDGATVTLDEADGIEVGSGVARITTLGGPSVISGGTVHAGATDYLDSYDSIDIEVTGGALTLTTMDLADESDTRGEADVLFMRGGRATVSRESTVDGGEILSAGGRLDLQGQLTLSGDDGQLVIEGGGGKVQATDIEVSDSGTTTSVDVHAKGSALSLSGKLDLGHTGKAALSLQSGGAIAVHGDFVAAETGATATIAIGQDKAALTVDGAWTIGEGGTATATIDALGSAHVGGDVVLGDKDGSSGTLTISGKQALLEIDGQFNIGGGGKGTLTVDSRGTVDAASSDVTIADEDGATGTATIQGNDALLTTGDLTVGGAGKATLSIQDGGAVDVTGELALGDEAGGSGTVTMSKAELDVASDATLGGGGSGALSAEGGKLTFGADLSFGEEKHGSGKMTLNAGVVSVRGSITLGEAGSGALTLNQGEVMTTGAGHHASDLTLGEKFGATGGLTLDGGGTSAKVQDVEDGVLGKGTISVKAGASLTANGIDIATAANANQNGLSLATGATLSVTTDVSVGEKGYGTFSLASGAQATVNGDVTVGDDAASIGALTVSGTGGSSASHLIFGGTLAVGGGGSGALTISKGGEVSAAGGGGEVDVAASSGSKGTLTMSNSGSTLTAESLAVGGTLAAAGGAGTMSIGAGAQATFDEATVWASGKLTLNGALHVSGDMHGTGAVTIGAGGLLDLGGHDQTAGVAFSTANPSGELDLAQPGLLGVAVKGFLAGDSIVLDDLDGAASFTVKRAGANTTVTFSDHGASKGSLSLAGHFTLAQLHLADGVLTTSAAGHQATHHELHDALEQHLSEAAYVPIGDAFLT